jgi:hypothetical protein
MLLSAAVLFIIIGTVLACSAAEDIYNRYFVVAEPKPTYTPPSVAYEPGWYLREPRQISPRRPKVEWVERREFVVDKCIDGMINAIIRATERRVGREYSARRYANSSIDIFRPEIAAVDALLKELPPTMVKKISDKTLSIDSET